MPEDELFLAASLDHGRRCIARLAGIERTPDFFAGVFVKGHRDAAGAATEADEALSIEQRMTGEAPHRCGGSKVFFEVA